MTKTMCWKVKTYTMKKKHYTFTEIIHLSIRNLEAYDVTNDDDEDVKDIYKYILDMHLKRSFYFNDDRIKFYSEQDYLVKFWAHIFETFFDRDDHLFIHHWGETMSETCNNNNLRMKLDMRLMITHHYTIEEEIIMKHGKFVMDGTNCEYAAKPTNSKLNKDKLKLVLGGYSYIKQIVESCPHLNEKELVDIKIPYLQIMGFRAVVSTIRLLIKLSSFDKGMQFSLYKPSSNQNTSFNLSIDDATAV
ncbi:unnamed protein product [Mucor hiemalis]